MPAFPAEDCLRVEARTATGLVLRRVHDIVTRKAFAGQVMFPTWENQTDITPQGCGDLLTNVAEVENLSSRDKVAGPPTFPVLPGFLAMTARSGTGLGAVVTATSRATATGQDRFGVGQVLKAGR